MILCSGEALIDMLPRPGPQGATLWQPVPGGAVFNTARALARLDIPVGWFGGLSNDLFGRQLDAALAGDGVDTRLAARSDRPSTLAFVDLEHGQARYHFYDTGTAGRMLGEADLPALGPEIEAAFFGGISLAAEPCAGAHAALMARAAETRVTMLDPNIRPGFIAEEAAFRTRIADLLAIADIVKLSDEDLAWLEGASEDVAGQARALLARGPRLVCITQGARGALAVSAAGIVRQAAPRVAAVDTVGAGDTFNAGLLAGLRDARALNKRAMSAPPQAAVETALGLAVAASAVTVTRAGADPPRRGDLDQAGR